MTSASNTLLPAPLDLFGENYDQWCIKMKLFFRANALWEIVENGPQKQQEGVPTTEETLKKIKEDEIIDAKALCFIFDTVSETIFPRIMLASTAKEAWNSLQNVFYGGERIRAIRLNNLRKDFENLKMGENEDIKTYAWRVMETVNQMKIYGEDVADTRIVQKILVTLTKKFDMIVAVIKESRDLSKLTVTELIGSLHAHDQKFKTNESAFEDTSSEDATWHWKEKKEETNVTVIPKHPQHPQGDVDTINNDPPLTSNAHSPFSNDNSKNDTRARGKKNLSGIYAECPVIHLDAEETEKCYFTFEEPKDFDETFKHKEWQEAMETEINMIKKNNTWELVEKPKDRRMIGVKWVSKTKLNPNGSINKHKARVAKRYSQQAGIDYGDTFAPVVHHATSSRRRRKSSNLRIWRYKRKKKRKWNIQVPQFQAWCYTKSLKEEC